MSIDGAGREFGSTPPAGPDCKLAELAEAIQQRKGLENCLGVVACHRCYGIFEIDYLAGKVQVENIVFVPCMLGYSNNPEAHLDS